MRRDGARRRPGASRVLTSDLVQVRRRGDAIEPRWLDGAQRARLLPVAEALVAATAGGVGLAREDVEAAWQAVPFAVRDRVAAAGLRKLIDDRCTWEAGDEAAAQALRAEVFLAAAAARRDLAPAGRFDRAAVIAAAAEARAVGPEAVEAGLFADLRSAQRLVAWEAIEAGALLDLYDVSLVQAVLLRATRVTVDVRGEGPERLRKLFRAAAFHGLIHVVRPIEGGHRIELDGPMSLFDAVQRYGLRLALFFPHVLACGDFTLEADVVWGTKREARRLRLDAGAGLLPPRGLDGAPAVRPEVEALLAAWAALGTRWTARPCERVIALPGEVVVAPDVTFEDPSTGEEVFLEVFGFWSRAAVFTRVEQIRRGLGGRMILAVGKHLRVSEELLGEDDAGEIHVYKTAISARAILERLERGAARP
jgi:predicted nuclease of restriction endonuclease-like RecB superfamily